MASERSFSTAINLLRQATDILSASSTEINSDATSTVPPNNSNQSSDQPRLTNRLNRCVSNQTSAQVVQPRRTYSIKTDHRKSNRSIDGNRC